ncbi:glycerophosphocholine phosphodiesterase GPCPD1-like [Haematobia irritans]|uniref:glycerophosphocholine phosphodiesterase GPCPD1-like n=1 Tax=Haematobia irritans TaxID=7368 RepID=UPI003F506426
MIKESLLIILWSLLCQIGNGFYGEASIIGCTRTFNVDMKHHKLAPDEFVGLTGDDKSLGVWKPHSSIPLMRNIDEGGREVWSAKVFLLTCNTNYRYFTYTRGQLNKKHIRHWETHMQPRSIDAACRANCSHIDVFGEKANGDIQFHRGWITNEVIYQFKFQHERMFLKSEPESIWIEVIPLGENLSGINVEVVKMKPGKSLLRKQSPMGVFRKRREVVIFHVTVPKGTSPGFLLNFRSAKGRLLGKTVITSSQLRGSEGELDLSIDNSHTGEQSSGISRLKLPYLVIRPFSKKYLLDFRTTYAHYWPETWPTLDIGHRGNGKSFITNPPRERENTKESFLRAHTEYADMVELDVHVTADGVPVLYHDFGLDTAPLGVQVTDESQLQHVLIKDVTYAALCSMRVFAVIDNQITEYPSHIAEPIVERRLFPRLVDVLKALPKTLGIDVEIKWPQRMKYSGVESEQTLDKNFFVDRILEDVILKGCGRPLFFSSFDADICTMIRFKQNIYPVVFLTIGETKKWEPYRDLRTRSFQQAVNYAQAFELLGTAPHAEDFVDNDNAEQMIDWAHSLDQVVVVWGDDLNSKEGVNYFRSIGADAICYDRSDLYMPEFKRRAFFNSAKSLQEFRGQCRVKFIERVFVSCTLEVSPQSHLMHRLYCNLVELIPF